MDIKGLTVEEGPDVTNYMCAIMPVASAKIVFFDTHPDERCFLTTPINEGSIVRHGRSGMIISRGATPEKALREGLERLRRLDQQSFRRMFSGRRINDTEGLWGARFVILNPDSPPDFSSVNLNTHMVGAPKSHGGKDTDDETESKSGGDAGDTKPETRGKRRRKRKRKQEPIREEADGPTRKRKKRRKRTQTEEDEG